MRSTSLEVLRNHRFRRQRRIELSGGPILSGLGLASFLFIWYISVRQGWVVLPGPDKVAATYLRLAVYGDPLFGKNLLQLTMASLVTVLYGCLLAILVAVPLGVIMGGIPVVEAFFRGIVESLRPIPPLAWIPVAYLVFTMLPHPTVYVQTFIVFVGAFFPILLNTIYGIKTVDRVHLEAALTMGASRWTLLIKVMLPSALPALFTGIRVGLGIGWMCIIAAEFVGGKLGIGYYIWSAYHLGGREAEVLAGIIAIGLVGFLMSWSVSFLEKRFLPWR